MDKGIVVLITEADGLGVGIVIHTGYQHHLGAVAAGSLDLGKRSALGDADDGMDAHVAGGKSHTLCVVTGRAGNNTAALLLLSEGGDLIIGAAQLECAGLLQALSLQVDRTAVNLTGGDQGRFVDHSGKHTACIPDHFHLQHDCFLLSSSLYFSGVHFPFICLYDSTSLHQMQR